MVSVDPADPHDHPSREARALASGGLSLLLAVEVTIAGRTVADRDGPARANPADKRREPGLGSAAYPRRTAGRGASAPDTQILCRILQPC